MSYITKIENEIEDMIGNIKNTSTAKNDVEQQYMEWKHFYEMDLLKLKYSEEYKKYETLTEREEQAKRALNQQKTALIELECDIARLNDEIEVYRLALTYLLQKHAKQVNDLPVTTIKLNNEYENEINRFNKQLEERIKQSKK